MSSAVGWVCLVIVGVPLAAAVAHRRWRRSGDARDAALPGWRPVAIALLCAVGCLAAVALMLALSAVTHAHIAEPVRWSPDFLARLVFFEEQAIVVVAVLCALIAAATARSARTVAFSVVVGIAVATVGAMALPTAGDIGHCFGSLSIRYAHPPSGACLTGPDAAFVRPTVLGAALAGILFVPAAHAAGMLAGRRTRHVHLAAGAKAVGWLAAAAALIAAITGTALWGPGASAHGVEPAGSIGSDGWIRGHGYEIRLILNWYALPQAGKPGPVVFTFPFDGATIYLLGAARGAAHVRVRDPGVFCSPRRPRSASQPVRGPPPQAGEDQAALGEVAVGRVGDPADQVLRSQPAGVFETFGQAVQGAGPRHDEGCLVRGEER